MITSVYVYKSELRAMAGEARRFPTSETGGDLYGSFTHGNAPVVWLASGPGPKAKHLATHFEQDTAFIGLWQRRLMDDFGIQYIGSWHSHHTLGLKHPSTGDVMAAQRYAVRHHRARTLEVIANHEKQGRVTALRPFFYPDAQRSSYIPAVFECLADESPLRRELRHSEREFSCGLDWNTVAEGEFTFDLQSPTPRKRSEPRATCEAPDPGAVPDEVRAAVLKLDESDVEIEQRGALIMLTIPLDDSRLIAVVIERTAELPVIQTNYIDQDAETNTDITPQLKTAGLTLAVSRNVTVLSEILAVASQRAGE